MVQFNTTVFLLLPYAPVLLLRMLQLASCVGATANGSIINVIVIGDSTAANYTFDPRKYPLVGWAMFLQDQFNASAADIVVVRDLAVAGRSSKSYYDELIWQQVKSTYLSAGDYVFIQFGHNDQKTADPSRHTDPFTTFKQYLTFYINDTRAVMATPVLLTPISRAIWESGGGPFKQTLGEYPVAMRQLAAELQVPLIDLNQETAALFSKLGQDVTQHDLFMCLPPGKYPNYPQGSIDTTHLQVAGAKIIAALAAEGIVKDELPLQAYLMSHAKVQKRMYR